MLYSILGTYDLLQLLYLTDRAFASVDSVSVSGFFETIKAQHMIQNLKSTTQSNHANLISGHPLSYTEAYLGG
jgi:hypothetical protein